MLLPLIPIDFELACAADVPVVETAASARVLLRWSGVPLGVIEAPVTHGVVRAKDVAARALEVVQRPLSEELVRRALLQTGVGNGISLGDFWLQRGLLAVEKALPTISLVVCTRDRPQDLAECLKAISVLEPAPLEVLIIDNAPSTDASRRLVAEHYPQFRYVLEPQPGLDVARNRGIREAQGEVIAFTDDDVVVDSFWISALQTAFAEDPSLGLVTGLIEPLEQETEAQVWFERYGGFGRGFRRRRWQFTSGAPLPMSVVGTGQLGAGANMAIRRLVFEETGLFDPALDVGTPTRGGGDHEMFYRLLRSGWGCLYEPTAVVRHRHRRTMEELRGLIYNYGYATRCFLEREAEFFPSDRKALRLLIRWWWRHWAFKRWVAAAYCPDRFPPELIMSEIKGFRDGRGGYKRSRQRLVPDESTSPDQFEARGKGPRGLRKVGSVLIDLEQPLSDLQEGATCELLDVIVRWRGSMLGRVRIATRGEVVRRGPLADCLAAQLGHQILALGRANPNHGRASLYAAVAVHLGSVGEIRESRRWPSVSVVVATCQRPEGLRRCLASLSQLKYQGSVEIIVVDNRPASGSAATVVEEFPGVRLVLERRPGSSYARNAGVASSTGEIIAMTDDDMVVAPDWLDRLTESFRSAAVMVVTGNTLPAELETQAERDFEVYGGFCRGFDRITFDQAWFFKNRRQAAPTWKIGGSGNAAFRASIFRHPEIGFFIETLGAGVPAGVGEDTMLFYQVLRAGGSIVYEPSAMAWHHHRVTHGELKKQIFAYSKGHVAYHLITWLKYRDRRGLHRILVELPSSYASRCWHRLRRKSTYPWPLLLTEMVGTLLGPWALWRSYKNARALERKVAAEKTGGRGPAPVMLPSPAAEHSSESPI